MQAMNLLFLNDLNSSLPVLQKYIPSIASHANFVPFKRICKLIWCFFFFRNKYTDTRERERGFNINLHHKLHSKTMVIQCNLKMGRPYKIIQHLLSMQGKVINLMFTFSIFISLHYWVSLLTRHTLKISHVSTSYTFLQFDLALISIFQYLTCIQCSNALNVTLIRHIFKISLI